MGANGAGKTNLLESLHVGTQGFSPRTRSDAELIRFGEQAARIRLDGVRGQTQVQIAVALSAGEGKRAEVNGARLRAAEQLRSESSTLVFTPDRLAIVKAGPAARRAYFDRTLGRLFPSRAQVAPDYAAALAQRNAALKRGDRGVDRAVDGAGRRARRHAGRGPPRGARAAERAVRRRGRASSAWRTHGSRYEGDPPSVELLEARLERDLDRGATGLGPHLDDVSIAAGSRDLRSFGSQGEQRTAVLALLLAEAALIEERRGEAPLLLLDDVLSELDPSRRRVLVEQLSGRGQTLITSTTADALPGEPAQLLHVTPGEVAWSA